MTNDASLGVPDPAEHPGEPATLTVSPETAASLGVPDPAARATLTVWPETAAILGLSKASAYDAAKRGEIPTIRIGRRLLVPTAALRRMLQLDEPTPVA